MSVRRSLAVLVGLGLLATAACSSEEAPPDSDGSPSPSSSPSVDPSPSPGTPTPAPSGSATPVEAVANLYDWQESGADPQSWVVNFDGGQIVVNDTGSDISITDDAGSYNVAVPTGFQMVDVLSDGVRALFVLQHTEESDPSIGVVVTLADRSQVMIDGSSTPPTINGGTWGLAGDTVFHPTMRGRSYCLAEVSAATGDGQVGYCAPRQSGFSNLQTTPQGDSLLTFSGRCNTPATLTDAKTTPLAGPTKCVGWDSALTANGAIWGEVANSRRQELSQFYASHDGTVSALGAGVTGSLTWCGDSAYFSRDSTLQQPAKVFRWTPEATLEEVYASPGTGEAFIKDLHCAGNVLSVGSLGEGGDRSVLTTVS